jgi:hypothetical protein
LNSHDIAEKLFAAVKDNVARGTPQIEVIQPPRPHQGGCDFEIDILPWRHGHKVSRFT